MYEAFFGLDERPFNLTPDPRFLYLSDKHKEALAHLKYAIENRTGFVMVSGEVGTGKTTICRSLVDQLDQDTELAFIFNPMLSPRELLRSINEDFGIPSRGDTIKELIDELNEYLFEHNAEGKNCVLVIDEAQNLMPEVLEQVRLLSNLETETQKLLQIVLVGQPELAQNLALPELRQLNQRITARYHLKPLSKRETLQYIAYRLRVAAGRGKVRFSRSAVRLVYKFSGGTPRMINAICDRALLVGYTRETRDISARIVRQAAREIRGTRVRKAKKAAKWAPVLAPSHEQLDLFLGPSEAKAEPVRRRLPSPLTALLAAVVLIGVWYVVVTSPPWASHEGVTLPVPTMRVSAGPPNPEPGVPEGADPPPPGPEAAVRPSLTMVLDALEPAESRTAAVRAILQAWGIEDVSGEPRGDSWEDLIAFGRLNRLDYTLLYPATDQLLAINLPALVRMATDNQLLWLALIGVEKDQFQITTTGDETVQVSRKEFQEHFTAETVILWKDPTPDAPTLVSSMSGEAVTQLQKNLQSLGRYFGPPSGVYDEATATAVAKIQAETGLSVDGMAGKSLRMVLCSWWLSGITTPALRPVSPFSIQHLTLQGTPEPAQQALEAPAAEQASENAEPTEPAESEAPTAEETEAAAGDEPSKPAERELETQPAPGELQPASTDPQPEELPANERVRVEELPPLETEGSKEVTPPAVATSPLVPRGPAEAG